MKTFVFDADGVVCVGRNFGAALEAERAIPAARLAPFFKGPFLDCIVGRRDLKELIPPYLAEWGWRGSADEMLAFWFQREHVLCPHVLDCVQSLRRRGHRCVLGTNQEKHRAAYLRQEMGLSAAFDAVFVSSELGAAKPSPEFFRGIENSLGADSRELCLIDDTERNCVGAEAVGWRAIRYRGTADIPRIVAEAGGG